METLSNQLRGLIAHRVNTASPTELHAIISSLCADEVAPRIAPARAVASQAQRYVANDETVEDTHTGLIWSRQNVGGKRMNWADAKAACSALTLGGFSDWRLPTIRELLSLVDYERHDPCINPVFECASEYYWTSTPAAASPSDYAWVVYFSHGYSYWGTQSYGYHVRAVRPGQIIGAASV